MKMTKPSGAKQEAGETGEKFGMQVSTAVARKYTLLMRLNCTSSDTGRNDQLCESTALTYIVYLVVVIEFGQYSGDFFLSTLAAPSTVTQRSCCSSYPFAFLRLSNFAHMLSSPFFAFFSSLS